MNGEGQPAAAHISAMDTPLHHAPNDAMPLVEWALAPMGHCWPKEEYASIIASIIHLDSLFFVTGNPLVWPPKHTKSSSDCLQISICFTDARASSRAVFDIRGRRSTDCSGSKGGLFRARNTVGRSHVGIVTGWGGLSLLDPFKKQTTKLFLPIDWASIEVCEAAIAAT